MRGPRIKLSHLIVSMLWMIMSGNVQSVAALGLGMRAGNLLTVNGLMNKFSTSAPAVKVLETPVANSQVLMKPNSPPNMLPAVIANYGNSSIQAWKPMFSAVDESINDLCGTVTSEDIEWEKKQCGFMCKKSPAELRKSATLAKSKVCQETQVQLAENFKEMAVLERVIEKGAREAGQEAEKRYKQQQALENINRSRELERVKSEQFLERGNIATEKARKKGEFNKETKERDVALKVLNQKVVEENTKLKNSELNAKLNQYSKKLKGYVKGTVGGFVGGMTGGAAAGITEPVEEMLNTIRTNKGALISVTAAILGFGALFMPGFGFGMVRRFVSTSVKVMTMPSRYFFNFIMTFATWTMRKMMPNRLLQAVNNASGGQIQNNVAPSAPKPSRWGPPIEPKKSRWGPPVAELTPGQVITFGNVNRTFVGMNPNGTPRFSRWSN